VLPEGVQRVTSFPRGKKKMVFHIHQEKSAAIEEKEKKRERVTLAGMRKRPTRQVERIREPGKKRNGGVRF